MVQRNITYTVTGLLFIWPNILSNTLLQTFSLYNKKNRHIVCYMPSLYMIQHSVKYSDTCLLFISSNTLSNTLLQAFSLYDPKNCQIHRYRLTGVSLRTSDNANMNNQMYFQIFKESVNSLGLLDCTDTKYTLHITSAANTTTKVNHNDQPNNRQRTIYVITKTEIDITIKPMKGIINNIYLLIAIFWGYKTFNLRPFSNVWRSTALQELLLNGTVSETSRF